MIITPESARQMLTSDVYEQRLSVLNHLSSLDMEVAFELVQLVVDDPKPRVRYAAISKLATVGHQDKGRSLELLRHALLTDSEPDVRAAAADSIGALRLTEGFEDLKTLYHETSDWIIQLSILAALGELGDPRGFEILEDALTGENDLIHAIAVGALGELGDRRAIPLLSQHAEHPDWQVRYRVAQALGHFDGPEVVSALTQLSKDPMTQIADEAKTHLP
ncbi:MAG: HEAT repeat domain-containing protein [Merismopedia sp. SIO2A8]|nr:HEAT repeat domain-containing protein [Merismopedia sp. SIO2A8]